MRPTLSPRRRRARVVAILTGVAVALAGGLGWLLHLSGRPPVYRPGENHPEITKRLSRERPTEAPEPRFSDVTRAAGLSGYRAFAGPRTSQLPEDMGPGAAWGDFDGDGDDDLFAVSAGGSLAAEPGSWAPSLLYENRGGGRFAVVDDFPRLRIVGMAAAWGDIDADGWDDLVVSGWNTLRLYRNQAGRLVPSDALPSLPGFWSGVAWGDFDADGDLDLYVCGYVRYREPVAGSRVVSEQYGNTVPYTLNPASYEPERNLLFRNDGASGFSEVAAELGVANPEGRSLGGLWHDFDDDGWLDLYVANDISDNVLFRNTGGRFEDVSHAAWVADYRGAMGLAAGDWNRDGDDDLFVTHWVAQENALYDSLLADLGGVVQRSEVSSPTPPGALQFADAAAVVGLGQIALRSVGWGAEFADLDADGWLDLPVVNGSTFETDDVPPRLEPQRPFLFWNRRGESFYDLAPFSPALAAPREGRGLALADFDQDGDVDILIVTRDAGLQLLRNDMPQGHWLELRLRRRGRSSAWGRGEGATIVARVGDVAWRRSVTGVSYLSHSSRTIHIGLGSAPRVDRLEVRWPGGDTQAVEGLAAGGIYEWCEGQAPLRVGPVDQAARRARVAEFWRLHRRGMRLLKQERAAAPAAAAFRAALELDPAHEDSRYYLASALEQMGDSASALVELETLVRANPRSHRALQQIGALRAARAASPGDLAEARKALVSALELNPEATGSLLLLGEVGLLQGRLDEAGRHLALACTTNPRAQGGLFLRGFVAWRQGDPEAATEWLRRAREARGPRPEPGGAVSEGDVKAPQHRDTTPLTRFWEGWDGSPDPEPAFAPLAGYLRARAGT